MQPERDWSPEQTMEMEKVLRGLVGLMVNLKVEPRNFSLEDNRYLNELMDHFDNRFPEHFNEIYETLTSITSKLNDSDK